MGQPVSERTTQFLAWCCARLTALGKQALLLVWDNASWHKCQMVRTGLRGFRETRRGGSISRTDGAGGGRAGVCRIKFHGLRHTCATLLLQASVSIKVVQEQLGHKRIDITLGIYAHALPSIRPDAATKLAALLHF
jgi:integrase